MPQYHRWYSARNLRLFAANVDMPTRHGHTARSNAGSLENQPSFSARLTDQILCHHPHSALLLNQRGPLHRHVVRQCRMKIGIEVANAATNEVLHAVVGVNWFSTVGNGDILPHLLRC